MKKLINSTEAFVIESLEGLQLAHPDLIELSKDPLYVRNAAEVRPAKVAVVSGGGSGHEPLHAGFVGPGMLDAAVPGAVFTSPTPDQILAASQAVEAAAGVVLIVKNYTGDVLNFETGAELAQLSDIKVGQILVNDDVAVEDSTYTAGRRGVAGTVLVEKLVGAAAARGDSLEDVVALGERVVANVASMGVALRAGTVPHSRKPSFDLDEEKIEIGIGIHGEPGRHQGPLENADAITAALLEPIVRDLDLVSGERVLLFVNGMGATPESELYVVFRKAHQLLRERGIEVARALVGSYVTSLDMQGASLSVLRLSEGFTELWDAPVRTPALRWGN